MDFLELLKSFGLNLSSVAAALGIDIAALNNMDKDVLLHLLTSQTSKSWFEADLGWKWWRISARPISVQTHHSPAPAFLHINLLDGQRRRSDFDLKEYFWKPPKP